MWHFRSSEHECEKVTRWIHQRERVSEHTQNMQNLKLFLVIFLMTIFLTNCQTIKTKTDDIVEKENKKLSRYIGKSSEDLQIDLGKPDEDFKSENGNIVFVYNTKKYGIPCERRFEINSNSIVVGFLSNGCF